MPELTLKRWQPVKVLNVCEGKFVNYCHEDEGCRVSVTSRKGRFWVIVPIDWVSAK